MGETSFAAYVTSAAQFWSEWGLQISLLGSLASYVVLGLLSWTRRRSASGRWSSFLLWAMQWVLGAAYNGVEIAATSALGSLSLCDSGASAAEQQLTAFWAPFLLLHLGGPDNMTASTLEDDMLHLRKWFEMHLQVVGVFYAIWNYLYRSHSWVLLAASAIMFAVGWARYFERVSALTIARANLVVGGTAAAETDAAVVTDMRLTSRRELDDGEALLLAQDLFYFWRHALVDSSVDRPDSASRSEEYVPAAEKVVSQLGWRSMCKVVEMELSLMYEVVYTKALVAHTWPGYLIRSISPIAAAAAASLFWLYSQKEGRQIRGSFVLITYLLLGAAIAMDVVWLLRALGSTWTYRFLKTKARWLLHHLMLTWRWRRLHRAVVYMDPLRLLLDIDPMRYRRWSGTIGRYNLLHECTTARRRQRHQWFRSLATKIGLEETWYLSELPKGVKELVFKRIQRILPTARYWFSPRDDGGDDDEEAYTMVHITSRWGQEALRRGKEKVFGNNILPRFGHEFEQDVLVWHIATCIFLSRTMLRKLPRSSTGGDVVAAIEAISEYLMFLVAKRRQMLPGFVLHSLLDKTRTALEEIWSRRRNTASHATGRDEEKLATILRHNRRAWALDTEGKRLVADAAAIAATLTRSSMRPHQLLQMLYLIFNIWVDKLVYASIRCSREAHAKQLSLGGELTTVVWMVVQHAGPFRIGEKRQDKEFDKKKKESAEEKPVPPQPWPWYPDTQVPMVPPIPEVEPDFEDDEDYKDPAKYITLH